ncbi:hypothetical protein [Legionella genomosp. 1]|uniref:hypothetical protein n=1 Tax=Legionella genomosp. 1 TaxID=1093625 RepID=UPI0010559F2B|nr:hypothetical protein [Legionella genomosp. 1]
MAATQKLCHYSQARRHLERSERSSKSWFVPHPEISHCVRDDVTQFDAHSLILVIHTRQRLRGDGSLNIQWSLTNGSDPEIMSLLTGTPSSRTQ